MIIESRKHPGKTQIVTIETWENMKRNGLDKKFRVVASHDLAPGDSPVPPVDVVNFMEGKAEVKKIYENTITEKPTLESLEKLTKAEIIERFNDVKGLSQGMKKQELIAEILNTLPDEDAAESQNSGDPYNGC